MYRVHRSGKGVGVMQQRTRRRCRALVATNHRRRPSPAESPAISRRYGEERRRSFDGEVGLVSCGVKRRLRQRLRQRQQRRRRRRLLQRLRRRLQQRRHPRREGGAQVRLVAETGRQVQRLQQQVLLRLRLLLLLLLLLMLLLLLLLLL